MARREGGRTTALHDASSFARPLRRTGRESGAGPGFAKRRKWGASRRYRSNRRLQNVRFAPEVGVLFLHKPLAAAALQIQDFSGFGVGIAFSPAKQGVGGYQLRLGTQRQ